MYDKNLVDTMALDMGITGYEKDFRIKAFHDFDALDNPAWHRIRVKDLTTPDYRVYNNQKVLFHKVEGLKVQPFPREVEDLSSALKDKAYGASKKHVKQVEAFANSGTTIVVEAKVVVDEPIIIQMNLTEENPLLIDKHTVWVKEAAAVTVVLDYTDVGLSSYHNGLLRVVAEQGAEVKVVKLQNLGGKSSHIFGTLIVQNRDSQVEYSAIDLGEGLTVTDVSTYLQEENANLVTKSIYLGDGFAKQDIGYNTYHNGRRTFSDIAVKGALLDDARKVFRGNLYFARGAKKSKGSEEEYVILLSDRVKADAIPALMCDEDDVQGEHAASAGQVDANKLFYLMSRGLTEKESKELIIMAAFAPVIEGLPIEGLKLRVHEEIGKKLEEEL